MFRQSLFDAGTEPATIPASGLPSPFQVHQEVHKLTNETLPTVRPVLTGIKMYIIVRNIMYRSHPHLMCITTMYMNKRPYLSQIVGSLVHIARSHSHV